MSGLLGGSWSGTAVGFLLGGGSEHHRSLKVFSSEPVSRTLERLRYRLVNPTSVATDSGNEPCNLTVVFDTRTLIATYQICQIE